MGFALIKKSCYLIFLLLFSSLNINNAEKLNECTKLLPPPIRKALQYDLCGPSSPGHSGPAQCAILARKTSPSWNIDEIADLCIGAESNAPATCVSKFKKGTSSDITINLCQPLGQDTISDSLDVAAAIKGPSECYNAIPKGWSSVDAIWLCKNAKSEKMSKPLSVECAIEAMKHNQFKSGGGSSSSSLVASICQDSKVKTGSIQCALALPDIIKKTKILNPQEGSKTIVSSLCQGALNEWPAKCYNKINNHHKNAKLFSDHDKVNLCRHATSLSPATCAMSPALSKLDPKVRVALCGSKGNHHDASNGDSDNSGGGGNEMSVGVAKCAEVAYPMLSRNGGSSDLLVRLCQSASGIGPTQCMAKSPLTIDIESRVELCQRAQDAGPAQCFKAIRTLKITHGTGLRDLKEAIQLCQQAQSSSPAECYESSPIELTINQRVLLCSKAINRIPAECAMRGYQILPSQTIMKLCKGLIELPPSPPTMAEKLQLQQSIKTSQNALRFQEQNNNMKNNKKKKLSEPSTKMLEYYGGPTDCAVAAVKSGLFSHLNNNKNKENEMNSYLVTLCAKSDIRAINQCFLKEELIGGGGSGARLPLSARVELCSQATSEVNARCASAAGGQGGKGVAVHDILSLCKETRTITPGACANHVVRNEMKELTKPIIEKCKKAISKPYHLNIEKMWWDGGEIEGKNRNNDKNNNKNKDNNNKHDEILADTRGNGLFSGRTVHILLSILDQFYWPKSDCYGCLDLNKTIVIASASIPKRSNQEINQDDQDEDESKDSIEGIEGSRSSMIGDLVGLKTNTSQNGHVEFHQIRFTASGEYDLKFQFNRYQDHDDVVEEESYFFNKQESHQTSQLIRVKVESHEDDGLGPLGQCGRKLYSFLSPSSPLSSHSFSYLKNDVNNEQDKEIGDVQKEEEEDDDDEDDEYLPTLGLHEELVLISSPLSLEVLQLFPPLFSNEFKQQQREINQNEDISIKNNNNNNNNEILSETCADKLSGAGIKIELSWGGSIYLRYRPVVFALDRNSEKLPSNRLHPCDRLGLHCGRRRRRGGGGKSQNNKNKRIENVDEHDYLIPSARKVRSAYYKASLLWHPDRWASFSESFQRVAQDEFELISEAYRELGGGNSAKNKQGQEEGAVLDEVLYL